VVSFDAAAAGTSAEQWTESGLLEDLPALNLDAIQKLVVVAAHPDDETLGAGGLISEASRHGIPVTVIVVTDGSASNPHSSTLPSDVAAIRRRELRLAVAELSASATIIELGFRDGHTDEDRPAIAARLAELVPADAAVVAPWRGDGHRDHRIVGEVCAAITETHRATLLEYPIWMWHWATPDDVAVPWARLSAVSLSHASVNAKSDAMTHYVSQVHGLGDSPADAPVLSAQFVAHFERGVEVFVVTTPAPSSSKTQEYFDELYDRNPDPWRLSTRWYETRKRAISVASLPHPRYESALEIGSSVGELTALIAERADAVLAIDVAQAAVEATSRRTLDLPNVTARQLDATTKFPDGLFDLIVLSEVGYYWDADTLRSMVRKIVGHLAHDGTVLACHWRHAVADYPLLGDDVHLMLNEAPELHEIALHKEKDFILEIFGTTAESVATREGLA
jgi:LmbE family N-acetylglucosaminyl deacetylase/SAM-dependent methyltransferase